MSPALVISRREIRTYFNSPVAYIVVTVFTILTGYLFFTGWMLEKATGVSREHGRTTHVLGFTLAAVCAVELTRRLWWCSLLVLAASAVLAWRAGLFASAWARARRLLRRGGGVL